MSPSATASCTAPESSPARAHRARVGLRGHRPRGGVRVDLAPGTRVAGLVGGLDRDYGTYAEQLVLAATAVAVVPDGLDLSMPPPSPSTH